MNQSTWRWLSLAVVVFWGLSATGCAPKHDECGWICQEMEGRGVVPVEYPRSDLLVGSLGWGDPRGEITFTRPTRRVVSDSLLVEMEPNPIAWRNKRIGHESLYDFDVAPGPKILGDLSVIGAKVGVSFEQDEMEFIEWGDLREGSLTLEEISQAIVRGWYNIPGKSMSPEGLLAMRPDAPDPDKHPWIVVRAISTEGLIYGVDTEISQELRGQVGHAVYGAVEGRARVTNALEDRVEVNYPMSLGIIPYALVEVVPPMPRLEDKYTVFDYQPHTFVWRELGYVPLNPKEEPPDLEYSVEVDPLMLLRLARRESADAAVGTDDVDEAIQDAEPVAISVYAEKRPIPAIEDDDPSFPWEPIYDGDQFSSDMGVRYRITLDEPAYLYLVVKDQTGAAAILYPKTAGEDLSLGESMLLDSREWVFPEDFVEGAEMGIMYPLDDEGGTESLLVIASKEASPKLQSALARFAQKSREKAAAQDLQVTRGSFAFANAMRVPSFVVSEEDEYDSAPVASPSRENLSEAHAHPKVVPFTGVGCATVVTINLERLPVAGGGAGSSRESGPVL